VASLPGLAASGLVHGLKLAAVAVVAQAVWGMGRNLCPDMPRGAIALAAALGLLWLPGVAAQAGVIALGAAAGLALRGLAPAPATAATPAGLAPMPGPRLAAALLLLFFALLLALPLAAAAWPGPALEMLSAFYRAGALVFGGGHVVLPLLQAGVVQPGWIPDDVFLAGYGAAQAVPGPLFTFAAYLGAVLPSAGGLPLAGLGPGLAPLAQGLLLMMVLFLPGLLLVAGTLPFWAGLRQRPRARQLLAGANAAVVGVLAAALLHPIGSSAIKGPADAAVVALALLLLMRLRWPPLAVVALAAGAGGLLQATGA
jgi:chromate transporter